MNLEIQTRHIQLDPGWRDLIERSAARLSRHYPEMPELRVTLVHGMLDHRGTERATLVTNVQGVVLRAEKERATVRDALQAAFVALAVELERHHERRHVTKRLRPQPRSRVNGHIGVRMSSGFTAERRRMI